MPAWVEASEWVVEEGKGERALVMVWAAVAESAVSAVSRE